MSLAGCRATPGASSPSIDAPTVSPLFGSLMIQLSPTTAPTTQGWPTVAPSFRPETVTPWPTRTQRRFPTALPTATTDAALGESTASGPTPVASEVEVTIYDEFLASDWTVEYSAGMRYDLADVTRFQSGALCLSVTPQQDYGSLFFTVRESAEQPYPSERVLGVRLWLNSGAGEIAPEDLAMAVVGSNASTHYTPDDSSVDLGADGFFSETRLYYLGLNRAIPADTWVEITVWLEDLPFDPDYAYVTGVYVKNDAGFFQTFYVDDVALILLSEGA
jgi:hypothetical protein